MDKRAGGQARGRAARPGRDPEREAAPEGLPAPVLGRHAPAGDDRDGARVRAEAADRRRADDRARRDDPGADPRAAARRSSSERDTALIMITHDLGVVAGMCERVNVMYAGMFVETGSADRLFAQPRHPYTLGLLAERAAARRAAGAQRCSRSPGAPRNMLERAERRARSRRAAASRSSSRASRCRRSSELEPGHHVRLLQPGAGGRVAADAAGEARREPA